MTSSRQRKPAHLPVHWRALLVLWISCLAGPLMAVTLGQETILSLLGDPLEVEIEVLQWDDIDLERVQIALASPAEYESFDLSWLPVLDELNFNLVGPNPRGEVKVLVSTREPVAEPYVELLLVMRWPGGSLLREYVLLFDLPKSPARVEPVAVATVPAAAPTFVADAAAPTVVQRIAADASNPAVVPAGGPQPVTSSPPEPEPAAGQALVPEPEAATGQAVPEPRNQGAIVVETAQPAAQPEPPATGRRIYQVREGDGLWSIAQQFQPAGVGENIYQMLLSLHDLNRAAFINGNISLLKANALLQIPDAEDIVVVDATSAEARFDERWDEGTVRLQTALRGDPLPAFSDLYEGQNIEEGPQAELEARAPGEESGRVMPGGNGLLLPATTPVVVPVSDTPAATAAGDLLLVEQGRQPATGQSPTGNATPDDAGQDLADTAAPNATVNPYLERINTSTRDLQALLQNRSLQISSLESQLVEMRQRMRDAQQVTARLNEALEQALLRRGEQQAVVDRNTTLLGLVALVLLVALLVAMVVLLKLTAQLRSQRHQFAAEASDLDGLEDFPARSAATVLPRSAVQSVHPQDTGILVEEAGMAAGDDTDLQQELLEIIGPAVADDPDGHDHGNNTA